MHNYYNDLINFIKEHKDNWMELLVNPPYCLRIKQCPFVDSDNNLKYPELYMLSYNQITSTLKEPIVRACRGCVISVEDLDNVKIICAPFYKFFNYGEVNNADEIDWASAIPQEKLDGSLVKYFNYKDEWIWVTNNGWDINTDLPISVISSFIEEETDDARTFEDLVRYSLRDKDIEGLNKVLDKDVTYMFELISPKNRIICDYPKTDLILLGCRNRLTYKEMNAEQLQTAIPQLSVFTIPKYFKETTLESLIELAKSYQDNFHEGFVVCDKDFHRIKVKCDYYLEMKGYKGEIGFTNQRVFEAILDGSVDDIISVFPEINRQIEKIKATCVRYEEVLKEVCTKGREKFKEILGSNSDIRSAKKEYAQWVFQQPKEDSKILFQAVKSDKLEDLPRMTQYDEIQEYISKKGV